MQCDKVVSHMPRLQINGCTGTSLTQTVYRSSCVFACKNKHGFAGELWWPECAASDTPNNVSNGHQWQTFLAQGTTKSSSTQAAAHLLACAYVHPCASVHLRCMCKVELCTEQPMIPTINFKCHRRLCCVAVRSQQATGAASIVAAGCCAKCRSQLCSSVLSSPRQGVANLHEDFCHLQAQRVRSQGGQRYQASHSCAQGCNEAIQEYMPNSLENTRLQLLFL